MVGTNHLGFQARLAAGKEKEDAILFELQQKFWSVIPATNAQDKHDKIDAWIRWKGVSYSVSIKYRESGSDLGLALVRPFSGLEAYRLLYEQDALPYDRDFQKLTDLYAVAVPAGLEIVTGISVKRLCDEALARYAAGAALAGDGYELKIVTDKGRGHTAGQQKLIAYLAVDALEKVEV